MPDRGLHDEVLAEIFIDRFRLGGRFDDYEILCHYGFTPATHRCSFSDQRLLTGLFVNADASGLENSTNLASKAKQPIFPAKLLALLRDSIPAAQMMVGETCGIPGVHSLRTKHFPGSARISSRISRVSS